MTCTLELHFIDIWFLDYFLNNFQPKFDFNLTSTLEVILDEFFPVDIKRPSLYPSQKIWGL